MSNDTETRDEILHHMAKAFFASAWAQYEDEFGEGTGGCEIMSIMPGEIDPEAISAAKTLTEQMEKQYGASLPDLLEKAKANPYKYADRPCNPEMFGHYAAMQAMGHGVGLESVCDSGAFPNLPYIEFGYYYLDHEKYPRSAS